MSDDLEASTVPPGRCFYNESYPWSGEFGNADFSTSTPNVNEFSDVNDPLTIETPKDCQALCAVGNNMK